MRVPSALCGIVGLRPTVGRTSTENCPENAFSIMSFGSHTVTIADAMLVYTVIANAGILSSADFRSLLHISLCKLGLMERLCTAVAAEADLKRAL